jgi:hypothetical protein
MNSIYSEAYKILSPYHVLNPLNSYKLNGLVLNNKSYLNNNSFSQLGYQIMNPQYLSYHLEPIYSTISTSQKSFSIKQIPKIEIGEPVEKNKSLNNNNNYISNHERSISNQHVYRHYSNPDLNNNLAKSDTQLILDKLKKLEQMTRNSKITTTSTNTLLSNKKEIPKRISTKEMDVKSYDLIIDDKKAPKIMAEEVTPFIRFIRDPNKYRRKNKIEKKSLNIDEETSIRGKKKIFKMIGIYGKNNSSKRKIKRDWLGLLKQFVNIYVFWSSVKKYSCINSQERNKAIYIRTKHIINDIAILKDWIISIEESFFNEFKNYETFNSKLNSNHGEKKQIFKKNILNIIKIFIDNLQSNINEIPNDVKSVLYEFIKKVCYFPKKYLSRFQINRIDFDFYGGTKNLSINQSAMILSYLIIIGVFVQQILLHIKDIFSEYSYCDNINGAVKNIGSILHYLVRDIYKQKQKKINDILALFNYYRNYHLYNKEIEKLKDKINSKINIEENYDEDEYITFLLSYEEVKTFFEENYKKIEELKDDIYNWSIEQAKYIKNKYNKKEYISSYEKKKEKHKK